jgi:PAS domain S-box-containing protein
MDPMRVTTQACLDIAEVMLVEIDTAGRISLINRKGSQILGYEQDELLGRSWIDTCIPIEERPQVSEILRRVMAGETEPLEYFETSALTKDGRVRRIAWHNTVLKDETGRIVGGFSSGEDITLRLEAEEALRASEAKFRTLAENSVDVIYQLDARGNITYVGPQAERYGFNPNDLISHHMSEVIHPDDEERATMTLTTALTTGAEFCDRYRVIDKHGRIVWMEASGQGLRDEAGRIQGTTGILRDITERVQVEEVLRESEDRYRRIFLDSPVGMAISGFDSRFLMVNASFCKMLGRKEEDFTLLTFRDVTHPDDLDQSAEGVQELVAGTTQEFRTEKRYVRPNGDVVWGKLTLSISRDMDGQFLHFLAMIEDVTARKAAELAVKESEERYRHLVDSSSDWVWEVDSAGVYTYASPRVRDVLGYEPEEIVGKDPFDLMTPEEAERVGPIFASIVAEQREFRGLVNTNVHKNGHLVVQETNGVPWFDEKGRFGGYRGMDRDITQRSRAEETLQSSLKTQRRLAAVVEASSDAIFWASIDAVIQSWNAGAERMFGYTAEEIVGRPVAVLVPHENRHMIEDHRPALERGQPMNLPEAEVVRKDGQRLVVNVKGFPVIDSDEAILAVFIREVVRTDCPDADRMTGSRRDAFA